MSEYIPGWHDPRQDSDLIQKIIDENRSKNATIGDLVDVYLAKKQDEGGDL